MDIQIHSVGKESAPLLAALHQECFAENERWDAASFAELFDSHGVGGWIAHGDDMEPQGFLLVRSIAGEHEILTIGVRPQARRRGVGCALLLLLQNTILRPAEVVFLEVSVCNHPARVLYESFGFKRVGHRPRYYADGSDALVLSFSSQ